MMIALAAIIVAVILGDVSTAMLSIPVPGSILGLLCAVALLLAKGGPTPAMSGMFDRIRPYAPLLFVPAGTGVVANLGVIAQSWIAIVAAILLGTAATLVVTGLLVQAVLGRLPRFEPAS